MWFSGLQTCQAEESQDRVKKEDKPRGRSSSVFTLWRTVFLAIVLASATSRLYKLELGQQICWDEVHFGKMASWYLNKTLFFDVHPPLGKLVIAGMGYVTGYNGSFSFDTPGQNFTGHKVMGMRYGSAILGSMVVPTGF